MKSEAQTLFFSLFAYNEQTGTLTWLRSGLEVGWIENGYRRVELNGAKFFIHHIIWVMMTGEWPSRKIDHKDRNRSNNKWENLRLADDTENARNKSLHSNNTSGHTGVSWNKRQQKWIAHITIDYKTIRIGGYSTIEDAIKARQQKELDIFKEFSTMGI